MPGRDRYIKKDLGNDVRRILKLDIKLKSKGITKINIPSHVVVIYTRLDFLLGLNFSGLTDILTEASNSIDELYKRGEIQNKQQYRKAPNNFST